MAGPSVAAKNIMLDALGAVAGWASLHTADPGSDGQNEAAGGSPAYARKAVTWAAAAGTKSLSNMPVFDVPAGSYGYFGLWSAASGGDYYDGGALSNVESYAGQGTYTLTSVTLTQS